MPLIPFWWNSTITIYNKYENPTSGAVTWHKTVLTRCFWKHTDNLSVSNIYVVQSESVVCRIPQNDDFLDKSSWDALADKSGRFTLAVGDIIVLGECSFVINEDVSGSRSNDLLNSTESIRIQRVVKDDTTIPDLAHYFIRGV